MGVRTDRDTGPAGAENMGPVSPEKELTVSVHHTETQLSSLCWRLSHHLFNMYVAKRKRLAREPIGTVGPIVTSYSGLSLQNFPTE